jgi:protein phosphatase
LAVADGIAFSGAGDLASTLSLHTLIRYVATSMPWRFASDDDEREELLDDFAATFERCHRRLLAAAARLGRPNRPMGTTLTVAYVSWPDLFVSHAGDSRCYLFRDGDLRQLTMDHTLAQRLASDSSLPLEDMNLARFDHILDNSVGGDLEDVRAEVRHFQLAVGDRILLCSDGLTKHLDDDELAGLLCSDATPSELCDQMIAEANRQGGTDNITAIVCDVLADERGERRA